MKVALCQINTTVGDFDNNKRKILEYISNCKNKDIDIIIFPELAICGYPPLDLIWEDGFINQNIETLEKIAAYTTIPIIIGFIRKDNDKIYNSAAICYEGKVKHFCDKILLPTYDVFDEDRYFNSGKFPKVFSIPIQKKKIKVGLQICEDLWDDNYPCKVSEVQKDLNAELIINISASPYHKSRFKKRKDQILKQIQKIDLPFLYCNMVGAQDELIFDGQSMAFSNIGNLLAFGKSFEEDLVIVNLKKSTIINRPTENREQNIFKALCLGIKDYFIKTGHEKAVIGLSGGIDSALVATLATEALGKENVYGVSLPSKYSSQHSLDDAKQLAINLDIDYRVIKIQDSVDALELVLAPSYTNSIPNVAEENIQSRVRGVLLMALANKFGWLLLSTGNKTELALGYCTLYGDMNGGLSVISDLNKIEVYALANWVNSRSKEIIPKNSIKKLPSAELSYNQVDPFDYSIISPLVDDIIENKKSITSLIKSGFNEELVYTMYNRIKTNEYKRRQAPPGLRVSKKAFGSGRRFPIINRYKG